MNKFFEKLASGRFLLTVIGGGVFVYATVASILDNQAVAAILTSIFTSYFLRSDRTNGKENTK